MVNLNSFVYGRVQLAALGAVRGQWDMLQSGCATGLPPYTEGIEDQGVETGNVERLWWSVEGHGVVQRQLSSKHGPGPPWSSASAILIVAQTYKDFDRSGLSVDGTIFDNPTPSVYAINVNSLAKAHAKGQLLADLQFYQISIAIVPRKI